MKKKAKKSLKTKSGFGNMYGKKYGSGLISAICSKKKAIRVDSKVTMGDMLELMKPLVKKSPLVALVGEHWKTLWIKDCVKKGIKLEDAMTHIKSIGNGVYRITI